MTIKTIFLDRDGVINKEINYLHKIEDFEFINGVFEACQYLESLNYKIIITTNQSGISRGYYTEGDFQKITKWMLSQFNNNNIDILDVIHCPHLPSDFCDCRKPKPGMFLFAKTKHYIDMENSWIIGDRENDIQAANNAGIINTILVKSGHEIDELNSNSKFILDSIKDIHQVIKY
ncbi:D-glycero-beta-D-manno-heptose 1,7-bisphosphate 7-phosphatase [Candidatus Pseudothioglobus singularis]|nr:D-glycero-beta-D-manno-heptose 1,7-bisphosphate 7-phosphatase [Candidatus Pseudothioglobus singularis]